MRYNHNHDPKNGQFCSGSGGSSNSGLTSGKKSGTIKSNVMTKLSHDGNVVNPMNRAEYLRIKNILENEYGFSVISAAKGSDDERFLDWYQAEAISDSNGIIHRGEVPSASAFFEEIVHCEQVLEYGKVDETDWVERSAREVAANRKILKNGSKLKFTNEDYEEIRHNLDFWEKDFTERTGLSYDEAEIKRDVSYIIGIKDSN